MLEPKKMKHRKWQKGRTKGKSMRGSRLAFGSFGLKAMGAKWVTSKQIEAARVVINRTLKRKGRLWIKIFPQKPITSKGNEVPMGGGKGSPEYYVFPVSPGRILFEIDGVEEGIAKEALRKAAAKLPLKTKFIKK